MRCSTSSSALAVRATRTTCAPAAANASAVAAPMPRLAPVTSASLPDKGFESVIRAPLAAGDQGKRAGFLGADVGQRRRIVPGEAGVAALRAGGVAGLAERPIETVDRDERQAVGIDVVAHFLDVHLRGEQLGPLGGVDAIKAAVLRRRRGDSQMHFPGPGIAQHLDDLHAGRAADDAVVDEDDLLALDQGRIGIVLQLDSKVADILARLDKGPPPTVGGGEAELIPEDPIP